MYAAIYVRSDLGFFFPSNNEDDLKNQEGNHKRKIISKPKKLVQMAASLQLPNYVLKTNSERKLVNSCYLAYENNAPNVYEIGPANTLMANNEMETFCVRTTFQSKKILD